MQKIRLWEVSDGKLAEIQGNRIPLEQQLENWLQSDFSVIDPDLLVIGRQVKTDSGGSIDLLCLNNRGDTVVVELKRGRTPREVTAQALDYASWVKNLAGDQVVEIFESQFQGKGSLPSEFLDKFGEEILPSELNLETHILVVAEEIDHITERIISFLREKGVSINATTVQHFRDESGRQILAQVYMIEPEEAEAGAQVKPRKTSRNTLVELEEMADENNVGEMFRQVREGVRDILLARPYSKRVWYAKRLSDGRQRTVLIVPAMPDEKGSGLAFIAHATRFKSYLDVDLEELESWLPQRIARTHRVRDWSGSSPQERQNAVGLTGSFQTKEEVDKFLAGLRSREQAQE